MSNWLRHRHRGYRPTLAGMLGATLLLLGACSSGPPRKPIAMPAVGSLRAASDILIDRVEVDDKPPDWLDRDRIDEGIIYGIGIQAAGRRPEQDLFLAMFGARRSIVVWLEARSAGPVDSQSLMPPVRVDPEHIEFERLARDTKGNRWYALARLDLEKEATQISAAVVEIEHDLAAAQLAVVDPGVEDDDRVRAALSILYGIDRRRQYDALYLGLTGRNLVVPSGLEAAALKERADDLLSRQGVRVVVEGGRVPGLHEAVSAAIGEVHMALDEFGRGLVSIRIVESNGFGPDNPYLEIDGSVEMAIDGGDARIYNEPFHVVSTGVSLDEARFRAARDIRQEVTRIVRETLRRIGGSGD